MYDVKKNRSFTNSHTGCQCPYDPIIDTPFDAILRPVNGVVVPSSDVTSMSNCMDLSERIIQCASIPPAGGKNIGLETTAV